MYKNKHKKPIVDDSPNNKSEGQGLYNVPIPKIINKLTYALKRPLLMPT
jgi:hypothetical protein